MFTLIQKQAPEFAAEAVDEYGNFINLKLSDYKYKNYVCLFFYPFNFTYVCPTEILSFSQNLSRFKARNTQILGISVDSKFSHQIWRQLPLEQGGIGKIGFPLVSDITKEICRSYGVLIEDSMAIRGTFLLDKQGIIRHITLNDLPLGRNVEEVLRIIDALQHNEENGDVCPVNWTKGESSIKPTAQGISLYFLNNRNKFDILSK